ncbi:MAG: hypothetical protein ACLPRE_13220 [Limisphaerales bacterium]
MDLFDYPQGMALARILVDGYSLLHNWPELASGQPGIRPVRATN